MTFKHIAKKQFFGLLVLLAILLVSAISYMSVNFSMYATAPLKIRAFFPFSFREKVDPRNIFSVGEQVMAEHLFSFHAKSSTQGYSGVRSQLEFDQSTASVRIIPRFPIKRGDGSSLDFNELCESIKSSLKGTRHAPYASILKEIRCDLQAQSITVVFDRLPINIKYLFTLPDFSIFDVSELPLSAENAQNGTGPYLLKSASQNLVRLSRNPNYPAELVSNQVEDVELVNYKPAETKQFIQEMSPETHDAAYFYGYAVDSGDLATLKNKGYVVDLYPTEWFVYILAKKGVDISLRNALRKAIDKFRTSEVSPNGLGVPAFSISPSDRDFSLSKAEYEGVADQSSNDFDRNRTVTVYTSASWAKIPFYRSIIDSLKATFPNFVLKELQPSESPKLFSAETDVALALLGISPSDPLSHFSFLETTLDGFSGIVGKDEISQLALTADSVEFNRKIKAIEMKVRESGLVIPIAHFPGVVAHKAGLQRDDANSFGWGIQTWSFRAN